LEKIAGLQALCVSVSRSVPIEYVVELTDAAIVGVYDLPLGICTGTKVGNGDRFFGPNKKRKEQYESQQTDFHAVED